VALRPWITRELPTCGARSNGSALGALTARFSYAAHVLLHVLPSQGRPLAPAGTSAGTYPAHGAWQHSSTSSSCCTLQAPAHQQAQHAQQQAAGRHTGHTGRLGLLTCSAAALLSSCASSWSADTGRDIR
jgi:hypothetical protein